MEDRKWSTHPPVSFGIIDKTLSMLDRSAPNISQRKIAVIPEGVRDMFFARQDKSSVKRLESNIACP